LREKLYAMPNSANVFHQKTPNPEAFKFPSSEPVVSDGPWEFTEANHPASHPFVAAFFTNWPVERIYIGPDFVTVLKKPTVEWFEIVREVREHIQSAVREDRIGQGDFPDDARIFNDPADSQLEAYFNERILPATERDGGGIFIQEFRNGQMTLKLAGACVNCPYAPNTIQEGIVKPLSGAVPNLKHIHVTD
jgi:Fe-S cluster biogenesis protein NfuA